MLVAWSVGRLKVRNQKRKSRTEQVDDEQRMILGMGSESLRRREKQDPWSGYVHRRVFSITRSVKEVTQILLCA